MAGGIHPSLADILATSEYIEFKKISIDPNPPQETLTDAVNQYVQFLKNGFYGPYTDQMLAYQVGCANLHSLSKVHESLLNGEPIDSEIMNIADQNARIASERRQGDLTNEMLASMHVQFERYRPHLTTYPAPLDRYAAAAAAAGAPGAPRPLHIVVSDLYRAAYPTALDYTVPSSGVKQGISLSRASALIGAGVVAGIAGTYFHERIGDVLAQLF